MPSKSPQVSQLVLGKLIDLGEHIRHHRKLLKLNATIVAESAGLSRVTLHRIEKGEPSVTMGAYFSVLVVLGLNPHALLQEFMATSTTETNSKKWLPLKIAIKDYPQLKQLAWHVSGTEHLTPKEALDIYENNWRHINTEALEPKECDLIDALRYTFNANSPNV